MSAFEINFPDFLAQKLHVGLALRVYHVYTPAATCPPIFAAVSDQREEPTTCESHFLAISQHHDPLGASVKDQVLVFGVEVLIFDSPSLTTIFVSKADSTGFLVRPTTSTSFSTPQGSPSIIRIVTSTFLEWLVSRRLEPHSQPVSSIAEVSNNLHQSKSEGPSDQNVNNVFSKPSQDHSLHYEDGKISAEQPDQKRLVLSLFARSQNQYLFPGSIENETKHVLDDRQLIKWWCRVLDGLLQKEWAFQGSNDDTHKPVLSKTDSVLGITISDEENSRPCAQATVSRSGFLIVPGCDRYETKRLFLPSSTKSSTSNGSSKWFVSYPAERLNRSVSTNGSPVPARCLIPRLPDDPKARFCDDLDESGVDDHKNWKAVKTLDQFWEMMSYRQECSAGRLVGFAWVVFDLPCLESGAKTRPFTRSTASSAQSVRQQNTRTPNHTHRENNSEVIVSNPALQDHATSNLTISDAEQMALNQETVVLSSEDYNKLADYLINTTDFAGLDTAKKSTQDWAAKVKELSGAINFGTTIHGKALLSACTTTETLARSELQDPQAAATPAVNAAGGTNVNLLVGVGKRKRKVEANDNENVLSNHKDYTSTSTIEAGRSSGPDQSHDGDGAKILAAGLVRKKPKPTVG